MVWFYDDQPGVVVRAYWEAPWRYHHYFPITGIRPRLGRSENPSAVSRPQKPAQTYRRSWSNNWAVEHLYAASRRRSRTRTIARPATNATRNPARGTGRNCTAHPECPECIEP